MTRERAARRENLLRKKGNYVYSGNLIRSLISSARVLLLEANAENSTNKGNNFLTTHGLAAIVISVTALEAFVNQVLFAYLSTAPNARAELERLVDKDLLKKISRIPQIVTGREMALDELELVQHVRHEIVHYFPKRGAPDIPACLQPLVKKGLLLTVGDGSKGDIGWEDKLLSFQLAKWTGATIARSANDFAVALWNPLNVTMPALSAPGTAKHFLELIV